MVPFDDKSPFVTSGMRIGTAAITTRGMKEGDMEQVVNLIDEALQSEDNEAKLSAIKEQVNKLMSKFPLYI